MRSISLPAIDRKEALRYAGVKGRDDGTESLLLECVKACESVFTPRVCYLLADRSILSQIEGATESKSLQEALGDGERILLFSATVGIEIDRLIARYASVAPAKALLFQAIGAERIEATCEEFCKQINEKLRAEGKGLYRRFSPGYGDFPLTAQRDIFRLLDSSKRIGLTLTDSLMMSPTKSVTAIVGIGESPDCVRGCAGCDKVDCEMRK